MRYRTKAFDIVCRIFELG